MAHRVQLRNKLVVIGLLLGVSCFVVFKINHRAQFSINSDSAFLRQHEGVLYYEGAPFTGYTYRLFPNGNMARLTPYDKGREDGVMRCWYPDKTLEQERIFLDGKKTGTHKGWWQNGRPKFEYEFANDEHNGTAKEWFSDGKLYRFFHYNNGHEEGLEQMWWADGTIRANYVVKDGQQYGLIGRKLCRNIGKWR